MSSTMKLKQLASTRSPVHSLLSC